MNIQEFIDPYTKQTLAMDSDGNLFYKDGLRKIVYKSFQGSYDFVAPSLELQTERDHYDKEYSAKKIQRLNVDSVRQEWFDETLPWRNTFLRSLGEIVGKRMLLVGNGDSSKEFYFHHMGADVVFTDLSIQAVLRKKQEFHLSELCQTRPESIVFHAVDANYLPFPDNCFDIIYGAAFVHHLDDLNLFFHEVHRCLKNGGICRFIDQAYAPLWEYAKRTVLLPLKLYSYFKYPRSPADLRADQRGGYKKEELESIMMKHGFRDLVFIREWFVYRLVSRHLGKFFNYDPKAMRKLRPILLTVKKLDTRLGKIKFMKRNQLMLVWGFKK